MTETDRPKPEHGAQFLQLAMQQGAPARLRFGTTFIGRADGNDVVLNSDLVSRRHAKIIVTDVGATVHDLDSHNGIFLNGEKVRSARVKPGDLLYFGNVCTRVDPAEDDGATFDPGVFNESSLVRDAIVGRRDDPAVRNLGALYRAIHLLNAPRGTDFQGEIVQLCLELTRADSALLIAVDEGGALSTPVILGNKGDDGVSWAVVRKAINDGVSLYSQDTAAQPLVKDDVLGGGDTLTAVMCVPILDARENAVGALWAARIKADESFGTRELETVTTLAHLLAARWEVEDEDETTSVIPGDSTDESAGRASGAATDLELNALNERIAVLESELKRRDADVRESAQQLNQVRAANEELKRALEKSNTAEQRAAAAEARIEAMNTEIAAREGDQQQLRAALEQARAQGGEQAATLGRQVEELRQQLTTAKGAMTTAAQWQETAQRALPRYAFDRMRAQIAGARLDQSLEIVEGIAVIFGVSGIDAIVTQVPPQEVGRILDQHREAIEDALGPLKVELAQSLGHQHLAVVPADQAAAVVAASLDIAQRMPGLVRPVTAMHAGSMLRGFFGDPQGVDLAVIGEPVIGARGISDLASPGAVLITKEVRDLVGSGPQYISLGLQMVRGLQTPVDLYQVHAMQGGAG